MSKSFQHDIEVPVFIPSNDCISCQIPLRDSDKKNKRSLCTHCTNEAMMENKNIVISNYGIDILRSFMAHTKYQKYNSKRKLLTLKLSGN